MGSATLLNEIESEVEIEPGFQKLGSLMSEIVWREEEILGILESIYA